LSSLSIGTPTTTITKKKSHFLVPTKAVLSPAGIFDTCNIVHRFLKPGKNQIKISILISEPVWLTKQLMCRYFVLVRRHSLVFSGIWFLNPCLLPIYSYRILNRKSIFVTSVGFAQLFHFQWIKIIALMLSCITTL
jgi:hypothetical protein